LNGLRVSRLMFFIKLKDLNGLRVSRLMFLLN
jgi:hypothetical protein